MPQPAADRPVIVILTGCTASGKSGLAHRLALDFGAEILSVDSMKVYREMDIGTAKPSLAERRAAPHHLIDVVDPSESFSAARFVELADRAVADVHRRGRLTVADGGTILYLRTFTEGLFEGPASDPAIRQRLREEADALGLEVLHDRLRHADPQAADRIHRNDLKRILRALEVHELTGRPISSLQQQFGQLRDDYRMLFVGLSHDRECLNRRINARVRQMMAQGFLDEAERLFRREPPLSEQARQALGYAELFAHLAGRCDLETAVEKIKINTRRFAKSQRTWFRRMPHIEWFSVADDQEPLSRLDPIKRRIEVFLKEP